MSKEWLEGEARVSLKLMKGEYQVVVRQVQILSTRSPSQNSAGYLVRIDALATCCPRLAMAILIRRPSWRRFSTGAAASPGSGRWQAQAYLPFRGALVGIGHAARHAAPRS